MRKASIAIIIIVVSRFGGGSVGELRILYAIRMDDYLLAVFF